MNQPLPSVSIVVRTWNALEYLKYTMEKLYENTVYPNAELIIADDCSDNETLAYLHSIHKDVLILNTRKVGAQGVTRQGTKAATGKYVAVLDSDVLVPKGWLGALVDDLETHQAHLVSANRFRDLRHPTTNRSLKSEWYETIRAWPTATPQERFYHYTRGVDITEFARVVMQSCQIGMRQLVCPPEYLGSSCVVYARDFVEAVGGAVDKDYYPYSADDVDLCWRIGVAGGKVIRSRSVLVHHFEHGSVRSNNFDYERSIEINNARLFDYWSHELDAFLESQHQLGKNLDALKKNYSIIAKYLQYRATKTE